MFKYKKTIPLSYERQGYIHFKSRCYSSLPPKERRRIFTQCQKAGGEHWQALLEFVTTDEGARSICRRHQLPNATLYRAVARYYKNFRD